jgi:DNA-binding XRE family transcriptional regulator
MPSYEEAYAIAFGRAVKQARSRRFWTQAALAQITDLSVKTVGEAERGVRAASAETKMALLDALKDIDLKGVEAEAKILAVSVPAALGRLSRKTVIGFALWFASVLVLLVVATPYLPGVDPSSTVNLNGAMRSLLRLTLLVSTCPFSFWLVFGGLNGPETEMIDIRFRQKARARLLRFFKR